MNEVQGRNRLGVAGLLVMAIFGFFVAVTDAAQGALSVRFVEPKADRIVTGDALAVDVRTNGPASSLRIEVGGKNLSGVKRHGSTRWTVSVKRSQLAAGGNDLTALARNASGERAFKVTRIIKGRRAPSLLGLSVAKPGVVPVRAQIKFKNRPDRLLAQLNGKSVTGAFRAKSTSVRAATLSPNDGLRFGTNNLWVRAARNGGAFDVEKRKVRVPRSAPLAAAGKDRLVHVRSRVQLNGRASLATAKKSRLTYNWRIVGRPSGSKPSLKGRKNAKPFLKLDGPGEYRIQLTIRQRGKRTPGLRKRVSRDTVTVTNAMSITPLGIPLTTITMPGQNPGISYGGELYSANFETTAAQLLIVDRVTGAVISQQNYAGSASDANNATNLINNYAAKEPVVILTSFGFGADNLDSSFNNVVKLITGETLPTGQFGVDGFSVIGVPGTTGSGWINSGLSTFNPGNLDQLPGSYDGYLQQDNTGHLTFTPKQRVKLDGSVFGAPAGQNLIQVGDDQYPSGPLESSADPGTQCGTGGFQVQAVTAEFLNAGPGQTFATNGCGVLDDPAGQQQMAEFLSSSNLFNNQGAQMVIIQSIGQPRGLNDDNWDQLTKAIGDIGGNTFLFGNLVAESGQDYGIIGISSPNDQTPDFPIFESASQVTGSPTEMTAILKPSRSGYMEPKLTSSVAKSFESDLSLLAFEPETGPAFPNASTQEEKTALAYIAKQVLNLPLPQAGNSCYVPATPDVRSEYCNPDVTDRWGSTDEDGYTSKLTNATYPGANAGFSEDTWNALRCDFVGVGCSTPNTGDEWGSIQQIWSDFSQLKQFILANSSTALADANLTAQNIRSSITTVEPSFSARWLDIFANITTGLTYLGMEPTNNPVGLVSTAALLAEDILNSPAGNPLLGEYDTTANVFVADLAASFTGSYAQLDHTRNIILTSANKMQTMANGDYVPGNLSQSIPAVTFGVARFSYETLLPAAYEPVELPRIGVNSGLTSVKQYQCGDRDLNVSYYPFPNEPASGQWLPNGGNLYALVRKGSSLPDGNSRVYPPTPPATLTDPLFKPYATDSTSLIPTQFAFYPDTFFPSLWDIPNARTVSDC